MGAEAGVSKTMASYNLLLISYPFLTPALGAFARLIPNETISALILARKFPYHRTFKQRTVKDAITPFATFFKSLQRRVVITDALRPNNVLRKYMRTWNASGPLAVGSR